MGAAAPNDKKACKGVICLIAVFDCEVAYYHHACFQGLSLVPAPPPPAVHTAWFRQLIALIFHGLYMSWQVLLRPPGVWRNARALVLWIKGSDFTFVFCRQVTPPKPPAVVMPPTPPVPPTPPKPPAVVMEGDGKKATQHVKHLRFQECVCLMLIEQVSCCVELGHTQVLAPWAKQDRSGRGHTMQGFVDNNGQWWPYRPGLDVASLCFLTCARPELDAAELEREVKVANPKQWIWPRLLWRLFEAQNVKCDLQEKPKFNALYKLHPWTKNLIMAESIHMALHRLGDQCKSQWFHILAWPASFSKHVVIRGTAAPVEAVVQCIMQEPQCYNQGSVELYVHDLHVVMAAR